MKTHKCAKKKTSDDSLTPCVQHAQELNKYNILKVYNIYTTCQTIVTYQQMSIRHYTTDHKAISC